MARKAMEAWALTSIYSTMGAAKESDDPAIIAATMAKPGVVLGPD